MKFNFDGLKNIYTSAIKKNERTLAFQINNGNGKFVFMMFYDEDDNDSKDSLFIFLRNTNFLVKLKMYGSHKNGTFDVYINDYIQEKLTKELQLENGRGHFIFEDFLASLNLQIPNLLHYYERVVTLREIWTNLDNNFRSSIIDEADKIILKGIVRLPDTKRPQEKTLRKLFFYVESNVNDITELIDRLKERNITLSWTNNPDLEITFADALMKVNN